MRLLLVEDEPGIANFLKQGLEEEGYALDWASDGDEGLDLALTGDYALLILDWMVPGKSGIEICTQFRKSFPRVPVLFLTAKDTVKETIFGLQVGANDYIKKPFHFDELLERIRVQLRPLAGGQADLVLGPIAINKAAHKVTKNGEEIALTQKEFALLEMLVENKGQVCTRTRIIETVWDIHFDYNVLFVMENPAYIEMQQSFLEAKSELSYLKADYERQKTLSADQISSEKTFLKAQSDYEMTLARYESLKKKLELMNINPSQITAETMRSTIAVNSPISGYITSVNASMGMFLNPSDPAVTIMNTDHLHIELSIFEKNLSQIKIGQAVNFTIQNDPVEHKAAVYLINRAIDTESRTVRVHCHLSDESLTSNYTPGMFVEASIVTNGSTTLALPETAVVNSENEDYVLAVINQDAEGEYHYQKVVVEAGLRQNGFVQILNAASFAVGTKFLTKGAFNLITE